MFNISPDPSATPPTARQIAFISKLIGRKGKDALKAARERAGIPSDLTLLRLTKAQMSRLISELKRGR